jgi:holo-[acyl-carrier protein] synthase
MILGIGTDITNINRIDRILSIYQNKFINKILSSKEINFALLNNKKILKNHLAKRFSAKEAFSKACGLGIGTLSFHDIEIFNYSSNKPYIVLSKKAESIIKKHLQTTQIIVNLSMSDEADYATSFVVISN